MVFFLGNAVQFSAHLTLGRLASASLSSPLGQDRSSEGNRSVGVSGQGHGNRVADGAAAGQGPLGGLRASAKGQQVRQRRGGAAGEGEGLKNGPVAVDPDLKEASGTYRIPRGGLFELVSCPHYLGEVIVYLGLVLLTEGRRGDAWMMLSWVVSPEVLKRIASSYHILMSLYIYPSTLEAPIPIPDVSQLPWKLCQVVNLVLAADATHRWYILTFPLEYPLLRRKALFPFVW